MKYSDIDDWELDCEKEIILLKVEGKVVDWIYLDSLMDDWLEEMKDVEFKPVKGEP